MALIAQLSGGLGNQMFQYAAARALALRTGMELKLDVLSGFRHDEAYKRQYLLGCYKVKAGVASGLESFAFPGSRTFRKILRAMNRRLPVDMRFYLEEKDFMEAVHVFDPQVLATSRRRLLFMEGVWQCPLYFEDSSQIIRDEFVLAGQVDELTLKEAELIRRGPSVAVGVRSYREVPLESRHFHVPLGKTYFNTAVNMIRDRVSDVRFIVFSDSRDWAVNVLPPDLPFYFVEDRSYGKTPEKLWLMSLCDHFVISNSSFDWWGAWLGTKCDKIVIAPSRNTTNRNMIPDNWNKVDAGKEDAG